MFPLNFLVHCIVVKEGDIPSHHEGSKICHMQLAFHVDAHVDDHTQESEQESQSLSWILVLPKSSPLIC